MHRTCDLAVVGAGAAGLTAASWAARTAPGATVLALDGAPKIGAKILISGGGRCNVTHEAVSAADFNGNANAIARILRTFDVGATVQWFEELGVPLVREEGGKLFPASNRARSVVDALVAGCRAEIHTGCRVVSIERGEHGYSLRTSKGIVEARRLILATGGRSVPKTGSDGAGFQLARELGHAVTPLFPALVPLVAAPGFWGTELSGTALDAELSVVSSSGKKLASAKGSLLFTHFGLSGPVALDISRHWIAARASDPGVALIVNLLPGETLETVEVWLREVLSVNPRATLHSAIRGRLPERIVHRLVPHTPLARLTRDERRATIRSLVEASIPVERDRGFEYAEVTAGGIPLSEIDLSTMESRVSPGLYLCGEILDVDGRIGGFNFQWAWASGRLAGLSAGLAMATTKTA